MTLNFCTLFDSYYLSRGLAMYESLKQNISDFHLFIFAFDDLSYSILRSLNPDQVTLISLKEFENPELLEVKKDRTKAEYCWTCTPSAINYVLQEFEVANCTYLDADLMFYNSPVALIDEMDSNSSVLITEHRFSPLAKIYEETRAGRFCVQFVTFNQSTESRVILKTWKDLCIEWCYNRYEEGKFGDQKYLDDWPQNYRHVHILKHLGGGVAPWNVQQYKFIRKENSNFGIHRKTGDKFPFVFYHFQYVKLMDRGWVDIGWHFIPEKVKSLLYVPYLEKLFDLEQMLSDMNSEYRTNYTTFNRSGLRDIVKTIIKKTTRFNLIRYKEI